MVTKASSGRLRIEIGWATIFRLLLGVLLAWVAIKLWPTFKLLLLAILIAVALYPIVMWSSRRGWPRWGLTVSPVTSLIILGLYSAYHLFENYFVVPKVYGKRLKLSMLAVLVAIVIGAVLAGLWGQS